MTFHFNMLELNRKLGEEFGELPIKKYRVRSKSKKDVFYIVEQLSNGKFVCDCPAYKECRHIKIVKKKLNEQKKT